MKVQNLENNTMIMGYNLTTNELTPVKMTSVVESIESSILDINHGLLRTTLTDQPIFMSNTTFTGRIKNPQDLKIGD